MTKRSLNCRGKSVDDVLDWLERVVNESTDENVADMIASGVDADAIEAFLDAVVEHRRTFRETTKQKILAIGAEFRRDASNDT